MKCETCKQQINDQCGVVGYKELCPGYVPYTNADAIRCLDDETLGNFLAGIQREFIKPEEIKDWLMKPCGGAT